MGFRKPCLKCRELTRNKSYCDPCTPPKVESEQRREKKAYLYGGDYKARAKLIRENSTHCHLCGKQFIEGDTVEADHLFPEMGAGSPLGGAHRHCNRQRGNTPL